MHSDRDAKLGEEFAAYLMSRGVLDGRGTDHSRATERHRMRGREAWLTVSEVQMSSAMPRLLDDDTFESRLAPFITLERWLAETVDELEPDVTELFLVSSEPTYFVTNSAAELSDIQAMMAAQRIRLEYPDADWGRGTRA